MIIFAIGSRYPPTRQPPRVPRWEGPRGSICAGIRESIGKVLPNRKKAAPTVHSEPTRTPKKNSTALRVEGQQPHPRRAPAPL